MKLHINSYIVPHDVFPMFCAEFRDWVDGASTVCGAKILDVSEAGFRVIIYREGELSESLIPYFQCEVVPTLDEYEDIRSYAATSAVSRFMVKSLLSAYGEVLLTKHPEARDCSPTVEEAIIHAARLEYTKEMEC